jgi:hypothetical protein
MREDNREVYWRAVKTVYTLDQLLFTDETYQARVAPQSPSSARAQHNHGRTPPRASGDTARLTKAGAAFAARWTCAARRWLSSP